MAKIERFEDIEAWKQARELTRKICACTRGNAFAKDFGLKDQIRRAAISTMSNIAEGFERGGNPEFIHFLAIAKGSCGEVRSQLYVALDESYIDDSIFADIYADTQTVSRMISGFIGYLQRSSLRGSKYANKKPQP